MRVALLLLALFLPVFSGCERAAPRATAPLQQDAYVWQRAQTPAVNEAVQTRARAFHSLVVLAAEVSWKKSGAQLAPQIARVTPDWSAWRAVPRLGLALRINAYPGPFARDDATIGAFTALARAILTEAAAHRVTVAEFQVDFDAATAKLPGYLVWINTLRAAVAPVPLTVTALPAWLRSSDFSALAHTAPNYVLQVHALAHPREADQSVTLCDPDAARAAIARAARLNVPFRVALPTYGYTLTFDSSGHYAGVSAEGPHAEHSNGAIVHEIRADTAQLSTLVRSLMADRPAALTGLIWYRLPVAGDQLNWAWPTLAAVMNGRTPPPHLRTAVQVREDGSLEFTLFNDGDGDFTGPVRAVARWRNARRTGADALGPFVLVGEDPGSLHLAAPACSLPAGTHRVIGRLRLSDPNSFPEIFLEN